MTIILEGKRSIFMGAQAYVVDNEHETASSWASAHITPNNAYTWVLGRFVEADRPNNNKQLFSLEGLQMQRPTIAHAPMNMNHSQRRVVGSFVATDLIYPTDAAADVASEMMALYEKGQISKEMLTGEAPLSAEAQLLVEQAQVGDAGLNPYIEALGVFWKHYFPEEFTLVEDAAKDGRLFYSMECVPDQIQCTGPEGCDATFQYAGRQSPSYCDHLNNQVSDKYLIKPHFTAGAILVPPVRPGWSHADAHTLVAQHADLADQIYAGLQGELPNLLAKDWEALMAELLVLSEA